jgi:hypothetical protein
MITRLWLTLTATAKKFYSDMNRRTYPFAALHKKPLNDTQVEGDPYAKYLSGATQKNLFVTTYHGYQGVISIAERILVGDRMYRVPFTDLSESIKRIVLEDPRTGYYAPFSDQKFFKHGGRVDCALDCLVDLAEKRGDDELTPWPEISASLPSCANDDNFDLVRRKFGLWGEY